MPSTYARRDVLCLCTGTIALGTAGCLEGRLGNPSDATARERALEAEEEHLRERFRSASCVKNWGLAPDSPSTKSEVVERTTEAVRVEVTVIFYYSTDEIEVDGPSTAVYAVTEDSTERVRGDSISPC